MRSGTVRSVARMALVAPGGIVIGIEIDHTDKALTDGAVLQRALDIDKAVGVDCEHAVFHVFFSWWR